MAELKACPFCGKEMSDDNFFSCDGYPKACGCWEHTHTGDEAVAVWNTRPLEAALQSELDTLDEKNTILSLENAKGSICLDELKSELDTLKQSVKEALHEIFDTLMKYHPADDDKTHPKTYIDGASMALAVIGKHGLIGKE